MPGMPASFIMPAVGCSIRDDDGDEADGMERGPVPGGLPTEPVFVIRDDDALE